MSFYGAKGARTPKHSLKADVPDGQRPWLVGMQGQVSNPL